MRRTNLFPLFFIFTIGILLTSFGNRAAAAQARNDPAPSFTLKLLNGKHFESSQLKGKVSVLKFVASY